MPEKVILDPERRFIEVQSSGQVTLADLDLTSKQVQEIAEALPAVDRLLADVREQQALPEPFEMFLFVATVTKGMKVAYLLRRDGPTVGAVRFAQTMLRNRGVWVMDFEERDEALEWLLAPA